MFSNTIRKKENDRKRREKKRLYKKYNRHRTLLALALSMCTYVCLYVFLDMTLFSDAVIFILSYEQQLKSTRPPHS